METTVLNIVYDLLQTAKISSNTTDKAYNKISPPTNRIHFVICNSCYGCASYFSIDYLDSSFQVIRCHVCNSHNTELVPISSNESFRIKYITRGMEMEFYRNNEVVDRPKESPEQQIVPP
jgi:hypothetical protein